LGNGICPVIGGSSAPAYAIASGNRFRIGSLEGSSGLLFRSWTAFNIFGWHDRRQSLIRVDSR